MSKQKQTIIIIGAGIAGLCAARKLSKKYDITLVEANNRCGGRIETCMEKPFQLPIEAGPEFIHGKLKQTIKLLKEAGMPYNEMTGKMYRKEKGSWQQEDEMVEGWDKLLKKMKKIDNDLPFRDFLNEYFSGDEYSDLRRHAIAFTEGFDLANSHKVSTKYLYREWSHQEETQYRVEGGYERIIRFLQKNCEETGSRIILNEPVKQVDWEPGYVTVYTESGKKFSAHKCIITLPVSILQMSLSKAAINFTPALDEYVSAARDIGVGKVVKIAIQFKTRFWQEEAGFIFSDEIFPTWWTQLPNKNPILTGWCGGSKAEQVDGLSEEQVKEKAILSLAAIFDLTVEKIKSEIETVKIFNWQQQPWAMGAYSYEFPKSVAAKEILNKDIDETLYFTGEALYSGNYPGTVEAAISHALDTAKKIG